MTAGQTRLYQSYKTLQKKKKKLNGPLHYEVYKDFLRQNFFIILFSLNVIHILTVYNNNLNPKWLHFRE